VDQDLEARLQHFLAVATEIAQGNLTLRGEVTPDAAGALIDVVNVLVERIQEILLEIRSSAEQVAVEVVEVARATDLAAGHTASRGVDLERCEEELRGLLAAGATVHQHSEVSVRVAAEALGAARRGQGAIWKILEAMKRIRKATEHLVEEVEALRQNEPVAVEAIQYAAVGGRRSHMSLVRNDERPHTPPPAVSSGPSVQIAGQEVFRELEVGITTATEAGEALQLAEVLADRSSQLSRELHRIAGKQTAAMEGVSARLDQLARDGVETGQALATGKRSAERLGGLAESLLADLEGFVLGG